MKPKAYIIIFLLIITQHLCGQQVVNENQNQFLGLKMEMVDEINRYRAEKELLPLKYNTQLDSIAEAYANYCVSNNWEKGHYDKEGRGFIDRLNDVSYFGKAYENLYFGWGNTKEIVADWSSSSGHYNNMLQKSSSYITIGIAINETDSSYAYVVIFYE